MAAASAIALMVLAIWIWAESAALAAVLIGNPARPQLELWAVRSASLAAGAGAQLLLLTFVIGRVYARRNFDEVLRVAAGLLGSAGMIGALTLAWAGR